jgi:hypothetical protein
MMRIRWLATLTLLAGCGSGDTNAPPRPVAVEMTDTLETARVYFGHQSVGRDILAGIAEVAPTLQVVQLDQLPTVAGGTLAESSIGVNGQPASKDVAFLEAVEHLAPGEIALYKYCYLDMAADTNPDSLFASYAATLTAARSSGVRILAATMPVTTVAPAWKRWNKQALGRVTDTDLNLKRQKFNDLVRANYDDRSLVDLARMESTLENGNRSTIEVAGRVVEVLPDAHTDDGAHLNTRGRRQVATEFVNALAAAVDSR